jgi:hypothetical protein
MVAMKHIRKWASLAVGLVMLSALAIPLSSLVQAAPASFADPAFANIWNSTDKPVDDGTVNRTWMWGPQGFYTTYEPYQQGPGGQHLVEYFDKSRMEINNPSGNRSDPWYVTNGLLVVDMITGRIQVGDQQYRQSSPANLPLAGDADAYRDTPTYASLASVTSINGSNRAPNRTGQSIVEGLGSSGNVSVLINLGQYSKYGVYEPTLGHNVADVFWSFMNQQGPIYQNGQYVNGPLMNWLYVMGYPITEPYWIHIKVAGQEYWVLMQAFQRRILTYSPSNPEGWKVEMGNVGRAYYTWRYTSRAPTPGPVTPTPITTSGPVTPTPITTPAPAPPASITINPSRGDATGSVQVGGVNFPPNAAVTISIQKASANYNRAITTVGANANGSFNAVITIPVEAAKLGDLTIVASGGGVTASQVYVVKAIFTDYSEVVTGGHLHVYGVGMPAGQTVSVGLQEGTRTIWLGTAPVAGDRSFDTTINIGDLPVGMSINALAQSSDGYQVTSGPLRVIQMPTISITPTRGSLSTVVTVSGTNWQPGRALLVGKRSPDGRSDLWLSNPVTTDGSGNFTAQVGIGRGYENIRQITLEALDPSNGVLLQAGFTVTR